MFCFPIEKIPNTDRYRRVEFQTKLFLVLTKDFLVSQELDNSTIKDIENFIDETLEETPINDINKNFIMEF